MNFSIKRAPYFINLSEASIFAWLHSCDENDALDMITIVCPPIGHEYMSSHRSMRHLTDALAMKQGNTIRFDYTNTGDSSDHLSNSGEQKDGIGFSIEKALRNVVELVDIIKDIHPAVQINAVGFGIGASILLLASKSVSFHSLVLWEPLIKGKRYARELKALSGILNKSKTKDSDSKIEAAGVCLTDMFKQELMSMDLLETADVRVSNLLYLHREELPANNKFSSHIKQLVFNTVISTFSGIDKMMTYPTETVVPELAISDICDFIARFGTSSESEPLMSASQLIKQLKSSSATEILKNVIYNEEIIHFGENESLFGVVTHCKKPINQGDLVVFLNCGAEHHVGPHRMYTQFSRQLSEEGYSSVRFDIEGIGDSVSIGRNEENEAYSPVVLSDIKEMLKRTKMEGYKRFLFVGICAGAYHSFIANSKISLEGIVGAVVVNPLVFEWNYEKPSSQSQSIKDQGEVSRYKKNLFSISTWKKIFSGKIRIIDNIKVLLNLLFYRSKKLFSQMLAGNKNPVSQSLQDIDFFGRRIDIILAKSDPGYEILLSEARRMVKRLQKKNVLSVNFIEEADHGMSKSPMRKKLYEQLLKKVTEQFQLK